MKIIEIKVMRGPNYWSGFRKEIIVMKLDIEELEKYPTNLINGFAECLEQLIPTLNSHRSSKDYDGGFFERVRTGTWMGHVVEHVALELQCLAGMECGYGRTRSTDTPGIYNVIFSYTLEDAGVYAAKAAVRLLDELVNDKIVSDIHDDIAALKRIKRRKAFGPSTQAIITEAQNRNIPYKRLNNSSLVMLGQGINQQLIRAAETGTTNSIAVDLASDKEATKKILHNACIPVPKGEVIYEAEDLLESIDTIGFPIVIKPLDGNHGRGVSTRIKNVEQAQEAFILAQQYSDDVILEKHIEGYDYRFLVINYQLAAVAKRTPAMVMGNGVSTIKQLIDEVNSDPNRGDGHENVLTKIKLDESIEHKLQTYGRSVNSILPIGEIFYLKDTANLSTGGTSEDVTDTVHPHNIFIAERIARLMNLDICGIDIVANSINLPITEDNGCVVEVNAGPGLRMHLSPSKGLGRNVAAPILNMLYPENAPSRIPIIAVTGTNGKTTTTRLIAHIARAAGKCAGYTTSDGIYINNNMITKGDCSGPGSAHIILRDPSVDFAVLECARGGIIRSGLGFDQCDISIVTNVTGDHLGIDGINTMKELTRVKEVVPQTTIKTGYAILNADDDNAYNMKSRLDCNIGLFSLNNNNERINDHCKNGGIAVTFEKGWFIIRKGEWRTRVIHTKDVSVTFSGTAECMIKNVLPSILAAYLSNFKITDIVKALKTFIPSPELTPGRMNHFHFENFKLMVDFAHNEDGYLQIYKYVNTVKASSKIGVIAATGDRRECDIRKVGFYAAQVFDKIIIRHDKNGRGRTNEFLTQLIKEGINEVNPDIPVIVVSNELDAFQFAIDIATKNSFVVGFCDDVHGVLKHVTQIHHVRQSNHQLSDTEVI